jgi:hypothetical protein
VPDENAEQQNPGDTGPIPSDEAPDHDRQHADPPVEEDVPTGATEASPADAPAVPVAPSAPVEPQVPSAPTEPGQRRITRHTTTSTTRTETTTDETIVETLQVAPPVWAAPAGEHPRAVG